MQLKDKDVRDSTIRDLQNQVSELTATRLLLEEEIEQLKAQLAEKERFAALIAHELRSPLTPIINYAQLLARPNQRRETVERGGQIIIGQAWRMARLVKDWLDASRLSAGQFALKCQTCNLNRLLKSLIEQTRPVAPFHTFELALPDEPLAGHWDADRLQQAVGNLLDNAIKYSDEETTITVRAWQEGDAAYISVHNMGMSISRTQVGQSFHSLSHARAAALQDSTGLGLFITRSIIEAHGGELRVEDLPAGQGMMFVFDLPL
jgi:signal transduction histidine kinase